MASIARRVREEQLLCTDWILESARCCGMHLNQDSTAGVKYPALITTGSSYRSIRLHHPPSTVGHTSTEEAENDLLHALQPRHDADIRDARKSVIDNRPHPTAELFRLHCDFLFRTRYSCRAQFTPTHG